MNRITLTPEQTATLTAADGLVALCRTNGEFIGWLSPKCGVASIKECGFTPGEIAAVERQATDHSGPLRTTREILDDLRRGETGRDA